MAIHYISVTLLLSMSDHFSNQQYFSDQGRDDERLMLSKIAEGDASAYGELFKRYLPKLMYYLRQLVTDLPVEAQDVVQDVFLLIWENKEKLLLIKSFENYVMRMARNRFLDVLRKENAIGRLHEKYKHFTSSITTTSLEEQLVFNEYHETAIAAISKLSPKLQPVFLMRTDADMNIDQIAGALGLPRETVKKRLYLAGQFIREYLKKNADWIIIIIFCNLF
jgi:RNA polymerase sigma factor (sigma-70 family)